MHFIFKMFLHVRWSGNCTNGLENRRLNAELQINLIGMEWWDIDTNCTAGSSRKRLYCQQRAIP
jgi:hypothetical protein